MEEKQQKPMPPVAVIAGNQANHIRRWYAEMRRKLKTCFAAARLTHLHRGASEKEIGVYDYLSEKIIDTVLEGSVTLITEINFRIGDKDEAAVVPPEYVKGMMLLMTRICAMLADDGFEAACMVRTEQRLMAEGDGEKIVVTHSTHDVATVEIHMRPGLKFQTEGIVNTDDVAAPADAETPAPQASAPSPDTP